LSGESYPFRGGYSNCFRYVFNEHRPMPACQMEAPTISCGCPSPPTTIFCGFTIDGRLCSPQTGATRRGVF
jgi:hypothetical protein